MPLRTCKCHPRLIGYLYQVNQRKKAPMTDVCLECNENPVDVTELYCFRCYLDREVEAMIEYDLIDQLWTTQEAN